MDRAHFCESARTPHMAHSYLQTPQLFLGLVMIGPWAALLIYDLVLYIVRTITYPIPIIGGRARGRSRPRAPSLTERPTGRRRRFSLALHPDEPEQSATDLKTDPSDAHFRHISEESDETSRAA
jgi:hypothetical protein